MCITEQTAPLTLFYRKNEDSRDRFSNDLWQSLEPILQTNPEEGNSWPHCPVSWGPRTVFRSLVWAGAWGWEQTVLATPLHPWLGRRAILSCCPCHDLRCSISWPTCLTPRKQHNCSEGQACIVLPPGTPA